MIIYTKHANQKFDTLNKFKVYLRNEQIEECVKLPDKTGKKGVNYYALRDGIKVIYKKQRGDIKILTFYPVK